MEKLQYHRKCIPRKMRHLRYADVLGYFNVQLYSEVEETWSCTELFRGARASIGAFINIKIGYTLQTSFI